MSNEPIGETAFKKSASWVISAWFFENFQNAMSYKLGELLTLADASFSDREQRKAFKDMIRKIMDDFELSTALNNELAESLSQFLDPGDFDGKKDRCIKMKKYTPMEHPEYKYRRVD